MNNKTNNESGKIQYFTDLDAWKEGHKLVLAIYEITNNIPINETFGLVIQMIRCAVSFTSNIDDGFSRQSYKEKIQFYSIAQGSVTELQNQLLIVKDVRYLSDEKFNEISPQTIKVHKIVNGLIKKSRLIHNSYL